MDDKKIKVEEMREPAESLGVAAETTGDEKIDYEDDRRHLALEEKRRLFEEEKDAILSEVPDEVKARFGTICFAKWGKQFLPVLVMNPYWVPPHARKYWLDMFENVRYLRRVLS